jgi:hypothetical protein
MASTSIKDRIGTGCLMLFALPFAAVGVGALYFAASNVLTWQRMTAWTAVPAEILTTNLEEHRDEDSTTHKATATYSYSFGGRDYVGNRAAISNSADNLGDFQQNLYAELHSAHARGKSVIAYVDPENPADATLNRELRWLLLAMQILFALVFGGVGFGLLFGARYAAKKQAEERTLQQQFPQEPWRRRKDWANARIKGSSRATAYTATGFAVLWNLVSLPAALLVPREVANGNTVALIALLFPLIGIGLAAWAVRAWWQLRRFKEPTLVLQRVPIALGGRLQGTVRVEAEVPVASEFRLELACVERRTSDSGRNRNTSERLQWQTQTTVPRNRCQIASTYSAIPVDIAVPRDQPPATTDDGGDEITWRLEVTGECPGPDFWCRFELPVFDVGEPRDAHDVAQASTEPALERPEASRLASLGIVCETTPQGGEAWSFRRAQHKGVATIITIFAVAWIGISAFLWTTDAPLLLPVVFSAFDLLLLWWALSLWFTEYRVTVDAGLLTITRRGLFARAPIEIPRAWVQSIRARRGMQAGNKLYYDLRVETGEGTHTAASSIADYAVATWLASHWMTGGRGLPQT